MMRPAQWEKLKRLAQSEIDEAMAELPREILAEARKVPVLFLEICEDDPDLLGSYGHFEPGEVSPANGPIILYLATIDEYCAEEGHDFCAEVRQTYLHELGHHLGWDEGDLEERGLD